MSKSTPLQTLTRRRNWSKLQMESIKGQVQSLIFKGILTPEEKGNLVHIERFADLLLKEWRKNYNKIRNEYEYKPILETTLS